MSHDHAFDSHDTLVPFAKSLDETVAGLLKHAGEPFKEEFNPFGRNEYVKILHIFPEQRLHYPDWRFDNRCREYFSLDKWEDNKFYLGCSTCALGLFYYLFTGSVPFGPRHTNNPQCESGMRPHCSCGMCF